MPHTQTDSVIGGKTKVYLGVAWTFFLKHLVDIRKTQYQRRVYIRWLPSFLYGYDDISQRPHNTW